MIVDVLMEALQALKDRGTANTEPAALLVAEIAAGSDNTGG